MWYLLLKSSWGRKQENNSFGHWDKGNEGLWNLGEGVTLQQSGTGNVKNESSHVAEALGLKERRVGCMIGKEAWRPGCEGIWMVAAHLLWRAWKAHFKKLGFYSCEQWRATKYFLNVVNVTCVYYNDSNYNVDSTLVAQKLKLSHLGSTCKVQEEIMMKWRRKNSLRITLEGSWEGQVDLKETKK